MAESGRPRGPLHRLIENLAGLASTRLALASIEAEEALERALSCLAWLLFAVVFLALGWGLILVAVLLFAVQRDALDTACFVLAALHLAGGALGLFFLRQKLRHGGGFFTVTREEFERDRAVLLDAGEAAE